MFCAFNGILCQYRLAKGGLPNLESRSHACMLAEQN